MSARLKLSQFNVTVLYYNTILIYNTLTKALASLSRELYKMLVSITVLCSKAGSEVLAYVETLKKQGFLVSANEDETKKAQQWYDKIRFDRSCMRLAVLTTYNCNFACVYCIENGVKKSIKMDDTYSSRTLEWIKKRVRLTGAKNLFVLFYGGEPLLNTKPIYYLAEKLHGFAQEYSLAFRFAITTNGYLLSEEMIERLLPYGLSSVKVTLDGNKEAHDQKRPHISGKGTFDKIIQNLLPIAPKVPTNLSVNVDADNIESLPLLMTFLEETHLFELIHTIDLNPIMPTIGGGFSSHPCAPTEPGDANLISQIIKFKEQLVARGFPVANKLKHVMCGMKQDGGLLVIDPVGQIYTCPAFVGREGFAVGSLQQQELAGKHRAMMSQELECLKCAYLPLCSGGCAYDAYIKTGDCCNTVCQRETLESWTKSLIKLQYANYNARLRLSARLQQKAKKRLSFENAR